MNCHPGRRPWRNLQEEQLPAATGRHNAAARRTRGAGTIQRFANAISDNTISYPALDDSAVSDNAIDDSAVNAHIDDAVGVAPCLSLGVAPRHSVSSPISPGGQTHRAIT